MHTSKRFTENISWLIIGTFISNLISIVVSVLIIRKLPVEDFGVYSLFLGSLTVISIFSINGVLLALRRFIPELIQKQYFTFHKTIIIKLFFISLLITFLLVAIIFQYKREIGILLNIPQFELYYSIFIINIFLYLQLTISQDILNSLFEQKFLTIVGISGMLVRGVLYVILLNELTIELIFIVEAISIGLKAIPMAIYVYKKISELTKENNLEVKSNERKELRKRITRYTLLSTANEIGEGGFSQVSDYYFISAFLGPHAMGLYAFPYKLLSYLFSWIPIGKINELFKLYFINKYYEKKEDGSYLTSMFNFLLKINLLFYGIIITVVLSYQKVIQVYLFDSKYIETQLLVAIIFIFSLEKAIGYPTHVIIEIKEKIEYTLYAKVFAVFNVLAVIFVLRYTNWGIIGVACATGFSGFFRFLYLLIKIITISKIKLLYPQLFKTFILLFFVGLGCYFTSLTNNLILQIFLPAIFGSLSFLILYRIIRPFNTGEEIMLANFFERISIKMNFISKVLALNHS